MPEDKVSLTARTYEAIKAEVKSGVYAPAQQIPAANLARRFSTSIIPVREALYRLAGERLVEARDHNGFYAPRVSEVGLRELYQTQHGMLEWVLDHHSGSVLNSLKTEMVPHDTIPMISIETLFASLAQSSGNREVAWLMSNTIDRLHVVVLVKGEVAQDWAVECKILLDQWQHGDIHKFKRCLQSYNRKRLELVPNLVDRLNCSVQIP